MIRQHQEFELSAYGTTYCTFPFTYTAQLSTTVLCRYRSTVMKPGSYYTVIPSYLLRLIVSSWSLLYNPYKVLEVSYKFGLEFDWES